MVLKESLLPVAVRPISPVCCRVTGEQPYERIKGTLFMSSLETCIKELLQRIFNFYHDKNPLDNNSLVENAKKVIENNFAGEISVKVGYSDPKYFSKLFKKITGKTIYEYRKEVRNSPL